MPQFRSTSSNSTNIFSRINEKIARSLGEDHPRNGDFPQWMRRCFMTGKHCIFCPQETVFEEGSEGKVRDSVFVIMPFRANLDTFYEWRLKPYLASLGIDKDNIGRADEFSHTGYVMCEKTCLRIQQAALVVVDLSIINTNVYYELGIAVGLNKPILAIADRGAWNSASQQAQQQSCKAIGLKQNLVFQYSNVGSLEQEREITDHVYRVPLRPRNAKINVVAILVKERTPVRTEDDRDILEAEQPKKKDISVTFQRAIEAAVEVAVHMLEKKTGSRELMGMFSALTPAEIADLAQCKHEHLTNENNSPHPFDKIAPLLDSALISIIDLAEEDPLAYFWLGYCHGRNINVIPIYRGKPDPRHVLAFDIRALWYMNHNPEETKKLADKFAAVLEPILIRDVNTQQRRVFWEHITRKGRVYIYNGAVHHRELNREVVGDWDLRTASELISYLSSTDESVVPVLQSPIYSPETIAEKLGQEVNEDFLSIYVDLVRKELSGKNCVIVASADVNPITEIVLACSYDCAREQGDLFGASFTDAKQQNDDVTVIAIKSPAPLASSAENKGAAADKKKEAGKPLPRRFARTATKLGQKRGFLIDGKERVLGYLSQDDSDGKCSILAHLAIVRNPFTPDENVIVILNGVSGPATFGLAEALTGGAGGSKGEESEKLLKMINKAWSGAMRDQDQPYSGVEAILRVEIEPPQQEHLENGMKDGDKDGERRALGVRIKDKFYDMREVVRWGFYAPDGQSIRIGNPRPFP